jgi:CRISPR-associated protein Cas1
LRPYYISSNGRIRRKENTLHLELADGTKRAIPVEDVETIHLFGEVDLNTKVLNFLSQQNKTIHVYNYYGYYSGSFMPRERAMSGDLTVKQVQHYLDGEQRFFLAHSFIIGAGHHILRNLRSYKDTEAFRDMVQRELDRAYEAERLPELMGCEGRMRDAYYQAFNTVLKNGFSLEKREKRPPTNPVNAMISFGNSMMYTIVLTEIYHTQLNATISYLHEPRERRYSLSLDLAEIFKPLIIDPVIFKLVNNNMIRMDDFEKDVGYCYLTGSGRKKFMGELDKKLASTIKHRRLKRNISYGKLIRLECYKLIKHFLGDEAYVPFKAWW